MNSDVATQQTPQRWLDDYLDLLDSYRRVKEQHTNRHLHTSENGCCPRRLEPGCPNATPKEARVAQQFTVQATALLGPCFTTGRGSKGAS